MNPADTISKQNCLPELFLQAAQSHFSGTTLFGVMLEITELCRLLSDEGLRNQWLSEKELHRHSSFKFEKRRNEWLGGRICAKLAAGQAWGTSTQQEYRDIVVVNAHGGRPSLQLQANDKSCSFDISISHSGNFAVALLANEFCGVDIQETNKTLLRVKDRFCSTEEEKTLGTFFNTATDAAELNLLWSAKEAIRKALSSNKVPDFLALNLFRIKMIPKDFYAFHFSYKDQTLSTICGAYRNYCLALCVQKGLTDAGTS